MSDIKAFVHTHSRLFRLWAVIIMAVSVIAAGGTYAVMSRRQTYTAHVNIKFTTSSAANGYANDGSKTEDDIQEITNADVIARGIERAGMTDAVTPNDLAPLITVKAVIPDDEQKKLDSALDNGHTDYEYIPVEYTVTLTSKYPETGKILTYIADAYETYFMAHHSGLDALPAAMENNANIDFIEAAELMDAHISAMADMASANADAAPTFRSSSTGYAWADLSAEYDRLRDQDVPRLYALILSKRASTDPALLRQKLAEQQASMAAENTDYADSLKSLQELIASYSEKNKSNGTVSNGFGDLPIDENRTSIMDGVYENAANPRSSYDGMFATLNSENDAVSSNDVSTTFNEYLLDVFADTDTPADAETTAEIRALMEKIASEENTYYSIAQRMKTQNDETLSSSMIQQMNTPVAQPAIRVKLYAVLAFAAAFLLMCVLLPAGYMLQRNIVEHILRSKH